MKIDIRTQKQEGTTNLKLEKRLNNNRVYWIDLHLPVDIKLWKDVSASPRKLENFLRNTRYKEKLTAIEFALEELKRKRKLTLENIQIAIQDIVLAEKRETLKKQELLGKELKEKQRRNVKNFVLQYVANIESGESTTVKGEPYCSGTISTWRQFRRIFLDFYAHTPFNWDELNETIVDKFIYYLGQVGYLKSCKAKYLKMFKSVVCAAEKQGVNTNCAAKGCFKRLTVKEQDKAKLIYLTKEELEALYEMPLEGEKELVRDIFLIGCYTAQRFSDFSKIEKSSIGYTASGVKVIRLIQQKTGNRVSVPFLDEKLEMLLQKYNYKVPHICDVILNRYIKSICHKLSEQVPSLACKERTKLKLSERRAEADGNLTYEYDEQGCVVKPRWELVSSHTARRSGITNMYLSKKYTIQQIMYVSGHKTERMFREYIKLSLDEFAEDVATASLGEMF